MFGVRRPAPRRAGQGLLIPAQLRWAPPQPTRWSGIFNADRFGPECIQVLRPDLDEPSAVFLGCSILGQVVGHGLLHGLNQAIWGNTHAPVDPGTQNT